MNRKNQIAQIHIAKQQLGMDDKTYRAFLLNHTGQTSSKNLTITQRNTLIAAFKAVGFKSNNRGSKGRTYKAATSRKIVSLWIQLAEAGKVHNRTDAALRTWCQTACGLDNLPSLDWLEEHDASKCIEQLKQWLNRD